MTDSDRRPRSTMLLRFALVVGLVVLLGIPVVGAMAASPQPSGATQPNGPAASAHPDKSPGHAPAGRGDKRGSVGHGAVSITSVSGPNVGLTTDDGWTRTITVTADTKITKAGATITVADLKVGDEIGLRQKKDDDGTYTITSITVRTPKAAGTVKTVTSTSVTVSGRGDKTTTITLTGSTTYFVGKDTGTKADLVVGSRIAANGTVSGTDFTATRIVIAPSVAGGEVTAKTSSSITVKGRGGKTTTIHVDSKTTYKVRGKDVASLADVAVGDIVIASGTLRPDGSLDASKVGAGMFMWGKHDKPQKPAASATP